MSNSHSEQLLLTKYFLLALQNQHLLLQQQQQPNNFLNSRVSHLEQTLTQQLLNKQQKIHELSVYLQDIRSEKQQLFHAYTLLQQQYGQQLLKSKANENGQQAQKTMNFQLALQQNQYYVRTLTKQKQQLMQQVARLLNVTIRGLQTDVEILTKENQAYMMSINNYRKQSEGMKMERARWEVQIKGVMEEGRKEREGRERAERQVKDLRGEIGVMERERLERGEKDEMEWEVKMQGVVREHENQMNKKEQEIAQLKAEMKQKSQQLLKKSNKLRQYDQHYQQYLTKMTNLTLQLQQSRHQSLKTKQQYQLLIKQQKQAHKQLMQRQTKQKNQEKQSLISQLTIKIAETQQQIRRECEKQYAAKVEKFNRQQQQLTKALKQSQQKCANGQKQCQQAINQWQGLLQEMKKQSVIVIKLEKQVQQLRKRQIGRVFASRQKTEGRGCVSEKEVENIENQQKQATNSIYNRLLAKTQKTQQNQTEIVSAQVLQVSAMAMAQGYNAVTKSTKKAVIIKATDSVVSDRLRYRTEVSQEKQHFQQKLSHKETQRYQSYRQPQSQPFSQLPSPTITLQPSQTARLCCQQCQDSQRMRAYSCNSTDRLRTQSIKHGCTLRQAQTQKQTETWVKQVRGGRYGDQGARGSEKNIDVYVFGKVQSGTTQGFRGRQKISENRTGVRNGTLGNKRKDDSFRKYDYLRLQTQTQTQVQQQQRQGSMLMGMGNSIKIHENSPKMQQLPSTTLPQPRQIRALSHKDYSQSLLQSTPALPMSRSNSVSRLPSSSSYINNSNNNNQAYFNSINSNKYDDNKNAEIQKYLSFQLSAVRNDKNCGSSANKLNHSHGHSVNGTLNRSASQSFFTQSQHNPYNAYPYNNNNSNNNLQQQLQYDNNLQTVDKSILLQKINRITTAASAATTTYRSDNNNGSNSNSVKLLNKGYYNNTNALYKRVQGMAGSGSGSGSGRVLNLDGGAKGQNGQKGRQKCKQGEKENINQILSRKCQYISSHR